VTQPLHATTEEVKPSDKKSGKGLIKDNGTRANEISMERAIVVCTSDYYLQVTIFKTNKSGI
jgi:hypothetical protein